MLSNAPSAFGWVSARPSIAWTVRRNSAGHLAIGLAEVRSNGPVGDFYAFCFRKITPPKADEFDREVIDLMTGQPVGEPA